MNENFKKFMRYLKIGLEIFQNDHELFNISK